LSELDQEFVKDARAEPVKRLHLALAPEEDECHVLP
jgi:hypothetical protein